LSNYQSTKEVRTWLYLQLKAAIRGLVLAQPFLAGRRGGSEGTGRDAMAMAVARMLDGSW